MNFTALLILVYFMIGFVGGLGLSEALKKTSYKSPPPVHSYPVERPPFEIPGMILLLLIFAGLPFFGYRRAKMQGTFLRFSSRAWLILPPSLLASGFVAGFLAFRFL